MDSICGQSYTTVGRSLKGYQIKQIQAQPGSATAEAQAPHFLATIDCKAGTVSSDPLLEAQLLVTHIRRHRLASLPLRVAAEDTQFSPFIFARTAYVAHLGNFLPIGTQTGSVTELVALDHRAPLIICRVSVQLLEQFVDGNVATRVGVFVALFAFLFFLLGGLLDELIPVCALF